MASEDGEGNHRGPLGFLHSNEPRGDPVRAGVTLSEEEKVPESLDEQTMTQVKLGIPWNKAPVQQSL